MPLNLKAKLKKHNLAYFLTLAVCLAKIKTLQEGLIKEKLRIG